MNRISRVPYVLILISARNLLALRCTWNQTVVVYPDSSKACVDCPICPPGYGVSPYCGAVISSDEEIKCVPCRRGLSYSEKTSIASCSPCSRCGPNEETIRECSPTQNAICGKCNHGYYREFTGDCFRCTWCCPNVTSHERSSECLEQGIPADRACRDTQEKYCGPPTPPPSTEAPQVQAVVIYTVPVWLVVLTFLVLIVVIFTIAVILLKSIMKRSVTHHWQRIGKQVVQLHHFSNFPQTSEETVDAQAPALPIAQV